MFSHRFLFLQRCSPTDFTDLHRTFAEKTPTDFTHRSYGAFKGGGGGHLSQVHQHNKIYILPQNSEHILAGIFSHRFHRFTQNFLAGKNSVKSVDSVGDIHALTSVRICEICGSFFNCKLRVKSVGVFQLQT